MVSPLGAEHGVSQPRRPSALWRARSTRLSDQKSRHCSRRASPLRLWRRSLSSRVGRRRSVRAASVPSDPQLRSSAGLGALQLPQWAQALQGVKSTGLNDRASPLIAQTHSSPREVRLSSARTTAGRWTAHDRHRGCPLASELHVMPGLGAVAEQHRSRHSLDLFIPGDIVGSKCPRSYAAVPRYTLKLS